MVEEGIIFATLEGKVGFFLKKYIQSIKTIDWSPSKKSNSKEPPWSSADLETVSSPISLVTEISLGCYTVRT